MCLSHLFIEILINIFLRVPTQSDYQLQLPWLNAAVVLQQGTNEETLLKSLWTSDSDTLHCSKYGCKVMHTTHTRSHQLERGPPLLRFCIFDVLDAKLVVVVAPLHCRVDPARLGRLGRPRAKLCRKIALLLTTKYTSKKEPWNTHTGQGGCAKETKIGTKLKNGRVT